MLFLNSSSSSVDGGTNTVFAERWGGGLFNKWCRNFQSEILWILLDSPRQLRKTLKNQ